MTLRAFTLVEILASVVVLAMLSVAVMSTLRFAGRGDTGASADLQALGALPPGRIEETKDGSVDAVILEVGSASALPPAAGPAVRWVELRPADRRGASGLLRLVAPSP